MSIFVNYDEEFDFEAAMIADLNNDPRGPIATSIALEGAMSILRKYNVSVREMPALEHKLLWDQVVEAYGFTQTQAAALRQHIEDLEGSKKSSSDNASSCVIH
jgi:hypothetical protein